MEKYKKKLQEAADMRQQVKVFPTQIHGYSKTEVVAGIGEAKRGPRGQERRS